MSILDHYRLPACAAAAMLAIAAINQTAHASLLGDTITLEQISNTVGIQYGPTTAQGRTAVTEWINVIEYPLQGDNNRVDVDIVDEDTIQIVMYLNPNSIVSGLGSIGDYRFTGVDWNGAGVIDQILNVQTTALTSVGSVTIQSPTSIYVDDLNINTDATQGVYVSSLTFDVIGTEAGAIPTPTAAGLGLIGLTAMLRPRRRMA